MLGISLGVATLPQGTSVGRREECGEHIHHSMIFVTFREVAEYKRQVPNDICVHFAWKTRSKYAVRLLKRARNANRFLEAFMTVPGYPTYIYRLSRRWLVVSTPLHIRFAGAWSIASILFDVGLGRHDLFGRSGAVLCFAGGLMTFRRYLRGREDRFLSEMGWADQPVCGRWMNFYTAREIANAADSRATKWGILYVPLEQ